MAEEERGATRTRRGHRDAYFRRGIIGRNAERHSHSTWTAAFQASSTCHASAVMGRGVFAWLFGKESIVATFLLLVIHEWGMGADLGAIGADEVVQMRGNHEAEQAVDATEPENTHRLVDEADRLQADYLTSGLRGQARARRGGAG